MKEKIIQALKQEYKNLGVSDGAFDGVASLLEKTITEESAISDGVKDPLVSTLLKSIQSDVDKERGEKNKAKAELEKLKSEPKNEPKPNPQQPSPNDELIKQLQEATKQFAEVKQELAKMQGEKIHQTTSEKITSLLREKKVPDSFISMSMAGRTFDSEFDVDGFVAQTSEHFDKIKAEFADGRFGESKKPEAGSGGADDADAFAKLIAEGTKAITEKK